jgi:hypothetical protein
MPSAKRLARRSVALLARQGLPRGQAAEVIMHVCDDAAHRLYVHNPGTDTSWLAAVRAEARRLLQREVTHTDWRSCSSLAPHHAHDWWPQPSLRATCPGLETR